MSFLQVGKPVFCIVGFIMQADCNQPHQVLYHENVCKVLLDPNDLDHLTKDNYLIVTSTLLQEPLDIGWKHFKKILKSNHQPYDLYDE